VNEIRQEEGTIEEPSESEPQSKAEENGTTDEHR
jgi:hypothetical protein